MNNNQKNYKSLKILMVTDSFYPDGIGGKHTYVYNLAKAFKKLGHQIYILTIKIEKDLPEREIIEGIEVFRYRAQVTGRLVFLFRPLSSFYHIGKLYTEHLKGINFDIIHFHSLLPAFGLLFSKYLKNKKKIFTFHASTYQEVVVQSRKKKYAYGLNPLMFWAIRFIEKYTLSRSDNISVLSEFNAGQLQKLYKIPRAKIKVIPGGVDIDIFQPAENKTTLRQKLGWEKDAVYILTVRRLVARMGIDNLIKAIKNVLENRKEVYLIIAGDGFLKPELELLISQLKLEKNVRLLGRVTNPDLFMYYQAADFFVLPTQELEGFGLVSLESLSCGLPVLGTPVGGTIEIIRKFDENLLFKDASIDAISEGIMNFLERIKEWPQISVQARNFAQNNYSWSKIAEKNEDFFREIMSGNSLLQKKFWAE
ncbi:MAG: glycosyltransferase family 4 protein [Candidatus Omnitrophota bacterium]